MPLFTYRSEIPASSSEVYAWHDSPGAFDRLVPPWEDTRVVDGSPLVRDAGRVTLELRRAFRRIRWEARVQDVDEGRSFRDVQLGGPFARWTHTHRFQHMDEQRSLLEDEIDYELPFGFLGRLFAGPMVQSQLARAFRFRHEVTRNDLQRHRSYSRKPLRIAITGSTGLIGSRLSSFLRAGGHEVRHVVRRPAGARSGEVAWDPATGAIDAGGLEGLDAVIHLAGENIGAGRWTPSRKTAIRGSRVLGTRLISEAIAGLREKPRVLVSSSAIGYYGDRGNEPLTEDSEPGDGFLPDVCRAWEESTAPARDAGIRIAHLRTGIVLSSAGGALAQMVRPFRMGAGGVVGSGRQCMSWIASEDLIGVIYHLIHRDEISGPVNAVSPRPVTNREFTKTLARILRRPAVLPLPAVVVRALFGEMGQALLLEGAKVLPAKLEGWGFPFLYPDLESALRMELGRWPAKGPPAV